MKKAILSLLSFVLVLWTSSAWATIDQAKVYKKAYGLDKSPKCVGCHVSEKPKKDENNELNEYGLKVKALMAEPDEEAYKTAGPIPEAQ